MRMHGTLRLQLTYSVSLRQSCNRDLKASAPWLLPEGCALASRRPNRTAPPRRRFPTASATCYNDRMRRSPNDADEQFSPEETARRRDEAIRRALNTPPKPQSEIAGKGRKQRGTDKSRPTKK